MADAGRIYVLATTLTFVAIVAGQMGNLLACRSFGVSIFRLPLRRNPLLLLSLVVEAMALLALVYVPPLQRVFSFAAPGPRDWLFVVLLLPVLPLIDELRKRLQR